MKRLLHLIASPRGEESRTLRIAKSFLQSFQSIHSDWVVDSLNVFEEELPSLSVKSVSGKYVLLAGHSIYGSLKQTWAEIVQHIDRFKTADLILVSCPMWNLHIPYPLKHYLDLIVQPQYLFRFHPDGSTEGLVKAEKVFVVTTCGGYYEKENKKLDFLQPYLREMFEFIGIQKIHFIRAEGLDRKDETSQKRAVDEACELAAKAGKNA